MLTTPSMAAKAPPSCPIRSRKPLSRVSLQRFLDSGEPVHALVASLQTPEGEQLVGLVHYLFHRSTTRLNNVCYLQDLIVAPEHRGQRIAAALIEAVYAAAAERPDGSPWQRVTRFLAGWMGSQGDNPMALAIGAEACEARRPPKRCGAC
jgi:GNAT superfamily N-acetyltransferase